MNQLSTTLPRLRGAHDRIVAAARGLRWHRKRPVPSASPASGPPKLPGASAGWACPDRVIQLDYESFRGGRCASEGAKLIRRRRRRPA